MSFYGGNFTQLADEYAYDQRTGVSVVRRYRGTPTNILLQANAARSLGLRYEVVEMSEGGYQEIRIYIGGTESVDRDTPMADIFSLAPIETEKNIWDIPKVYSVLASAPVDVVIALRRDAEKVISDELDYAEFIATIPFDTAGKLVIGNLLRSIQLGVESKPISGGAIRRKMIVPTGSRVRPNFTGVDGVILAENLVGGNDPSTGGPLTPERILFDVQPGWWMKKFPTVEPLTSTTWEINQEWWYIGAAPLNTFVHDQYGA